MVVVPMSTSIKLLSYYWLNRCAGQLLWLVWFGVQLQAQGTASGQKQLILIGLIVFSSPYFSICWGLESRDRPKAEEMPRGLEMGWVSVCCKHTLTQNTLL